MTRERLTAKLADAEHALQRIDADADPDRNLLGLAEERAERARQTHSTAAHDLAGAPRRQRHAAREVVAIAERRSTAANRELQRIKSSTAASIERYHQAVEHKRQARDEAVLAAGGTSVYEPSQQSGTPSQPRSPTLTGTCG